MKHLCIIGILLITLSSCRKCYECEAKDTVTGQVWDSETLCGADERDDYESTMTDPSIDSHATCTRM